MSLINRMLQDLDARSTDGAASSAIHGQVRAVPERRNIRGGWWLALLLVVVLAIVVGVWSTHRADIVVTAPRPVPERLPAELSLRIAPDLAMVPLPVVSEPVAEPNAPAVDTTVAIEAKHPDTKASAVGKPSETGPVPQATVSVAPKDPPAALAPPPAAITKAALPATPGLADAGPAVIRKQIKEPSPQQRAENEYRKATSLMQQGRVAETINVLEQVLTLDPLHAAARQTLVGLLMESKRQDDALRKMQEGLSLEPNQPGLAMILARQQVEKGELRAAVATLQKTLPHALEHADYQAFLAALLQRQSNHKEAVEHYLLALGKAPQNGVWWMGLGISLQAENRLAEAQDAFGRAKASASLSAELKAFVEQKLSQLQR